MPTRSSSPARREVMGGLAKGIDVIRAFSRESPALSLSEVATRAKLPAATARRCLHTLEELGFVTRSGRVFLLRPKVLELGAAYLDSMNVETLTKTHLEDLASRTGDSRVGMLQEASRQISEELRRVPGLSLSAQT